jgi:hypothetical protein
MQKVEGSNPFSRFFANALHVGGLGPARDAETRSNHPRISLTVTLGQGRRRRPARPVGSRIGGELTLHIAHCHPRPRSAATSGPAGWVSDRRRADSAYRCRPWSDLMRLCRSPPSEDPRLDLIGAWQPPRVRFVSRRSVRRQRPIEGTRQMIVIGADTLARAGDAGGLPRPAELA